MSNEGLATEINAVAFCIPPEAIWKDRMTARSVSYTHLDVYKRQGSSVTPTYDVLIDNEYSCPRRVSNRTIYVKKPDNVYD